MNKDASLHPSTGTAALSHCDGRFYPMCTSCFRFYIHPSCNKCPQRENIFEHEVAEELFVLHDVPVTHGWLGASVSPLASALMSMLRGPDLAHLAAEPGQVVPNIHSQNYQKMAIHFYIKHWKSKRHPTKKHKHCSGLYLRILVHVYKTSPQLATRCGACNRVVHRARPVFANFTAHRRICPPIAALSAPACSAPRWFIVCCTADMVMPCSVLHNPLLLDALTWCKIWRFTSSYHSRSRAA